METKTSNELNPIPATLVNTVFDRIIRDAEEQAGLVGFPDGIMLCAMFFGNAVESSKIPSEVKKMIKAVADAVFAAPAELIENMNGVTREQYKESLRKIVLKTCRSKEEDYSCEAKICGMRAMAPIGFISKKYEYGENGYGEKYGYDCSEDH